MKKKKILVGLTSMATAFLAIASVSTLTSCSNNDGGGTTENEKQTYTITFVTNGGSAVASITTDSDGKATKPTDPTKEGYTFGGWYTDANLTKAADFSKAFTADTTLYAKWTEVTTPDPVDESYTLTMVLNYEGAENKTETITKDTLGVYTVSETILTSVTYDYHTLVGWYTDEACTVAFEGYITADTTIYAKWEAKTEEVNYIINPTEDLTVSTLSADVSVGPWTVASGTQVRSRSAGTCSDDNFSVPAVGIKLNGTASLTLTAPGDGTIYMYVKNGSSGKTTQTLKVNKNGTDIDGIEYNADGSPFVLIKIENVSKGDVYKFTCGGTTDVHYAKFTAVVEQSAPVSITASTNLTNFLAGTSFDYSDLSVSLNYENGRVAAVKLSDVSINTDELELENDVFTKAGSYNVKISYTFTDESVDKTYTFDTTYTVNVYDLESIDLDFYATQAGSKTSAGNGTYINESVQLVYGTSASSIDTDALTITAYGTDGKYSQIFTASNTAVSISDVDFTTAGTKTVTVKLTLNGIEKEATFDIYVVDTSLSLSEDATESYIYVNPSYEGVIGALSSVTIDDASVSCNTFTGIQQALDFLANQGELSTTTNYIYLAAGTYNEKIEINIPNVYLKGLGQTDGSDVIIEWDSLYGVADASGYTQLTDSTQTVAVREDAENCIIDGVTISNYWNNRSKYISTGTYGAKEGTNATEHRALALLVQADKFVMMNGQLLGMQDTVELFKGRQYFYNVTITGTTDYIFGTNNSTLFESCTIKTLESENSNTGGYITAFKGASSGSTDYVNIGAVFDNCNFTSDENVPDYSVAIARPWGDYSSVYVLNSSLGDCIAVGTSIGTQKNTYTVVDQATVTAPVEGVTYYTKNSSGLYEEATGITEWVTDTSYYTITSYASRYYNGLNKKMTATMKFGEYNNTGNALTAEQLALITVSGDAASDSNPSIVSLLTETEADEILANVFGVTNGMVTYTDVWLPLVEKDATVVVTDSGGNTLVTLSNAGYIGMSLGTADLKAIEESITLDSGNVLMGLYTDSSFTTEFDTSVVLTESTQVYAKIETATVIETAHTLSIGTLSGQLTAETLINDIFYGLTNVKEESVKVADGKYDDSTVFTKQISLTSGKASTSTNAIKFTITKNAKVVIYAAEKSGKSVTLSVLDSEGKAATITDLTIDGVSATAFDTLSTTAIEKYEFELAAGTYYLGGSGGGAYIYGLTVTEYEIIEVDKTLISKAATYNIPTLVTSTIEGTTATLGDNSEISVDATSGKLGANNGGGWSQFNTGTTITFKVAAGATVSVTAYYAASFTINDVTSTNVAQGSFSQTFAEETTVVITATSNTYISDIAITFAS